MHKHHHHSCHQHSCCSEKGCSSKSSQGCGCGNPNCRCGSSQGCGCGNPNCRCGSSQGSSCKSESSSSKSCQGQCHGHGHGECGVHEGHILCLVKCIKHKLLKEKILKQLESKMGQHLDELAAVAVDAFLAEREEKINAKKTCNSFREKLKDICKE